MKYEKIVEGIFLERPNRFVAKCIIEGRETSVHVKNTGRCLELLQKGVKVYLEDFRGRMGKRKMEFSLIAVVKPPFDNLVNMDSQAPNKVVDEGLKSGKLKLKGMDNLTLIKPETTYKDSRFDFYVEDKTGSKAFIEVKGVTLENDGIASFPDAPTARGKKHLSHLIMAREEGYLAYIIFVIQMKRIIYFSPNFRNDPQFTRELIRASENGVEIVAIDCKVGKSVLELDSFVEVNNNCIF